jgi:hypothetical protein
MGGPRPKAREAIKLHELPNPIKIKFNAALILDMFQDWRALNRDSTLVSQSYLKNGTPYYHGGDDDNKMCVVSFKSHRAPGQAYTFAAGREINVTVERNLSTGNVTTLTVLDDPELDYITCAREARLQNRPEIRDFVKHFGGKAQVITAYSSGEELQLAQVLRSITHDNNYWCGVTLTDSLLNTLLKSQITVAESEAIADDILRITEGCYGGNPEAWKHAQQVPESFVLTWINRLRSK